MRFIDYGVYRSMVLRRPPLTVVPPLNKRVAVQRWFLSMSVIAPAVVLLGYVAYKYALNTMPLFWYPTKVQYRAEPDMLTGKITFSQRTVPNKLSNY